MRIEKCEAVVGAFKVMVNSNELMCDVRPLPYPTTIGLIFADGSAYQIWAPAASTPRGYKRSARAMLVALTESVRRIGVDATNAKLEQVAKEGCF